MSAFGHIPTRHVVLFGYDYLGNPISFGIDPGGAMKTISHAHAQTHAGRFFTASHFFTGITAGNFMDFLILTGANYNIHGAFEISFSQPGYVQFYKTVGYTGGSAVDAVTNTNDTSANVTEVSFLQQPATVSLGGAELKVSSALVSAAGGLSQGGSDGQMVRSGSEFILETNEVYLIRCEHRGSGTAEGSIEFSYYEHSY